MLFWPTLFFQHLLALPAVAEDTALGHLLLLGDIW